MDQFDYILIGTGQATFTLLSYLVSEGKLVAVCEEDRFAGTCANYGCTPTKALVAHARAAHMIRRGEYFGFPAAEPQIDFPKVWERMNHIRSGGHDGLGGWLKKHTTVFEGHAEFSGPNRVRIGDTEIAGQTILIHAGARASAPPIPGLDSVPWLDNKRLLDLETLPEHLIVVGGSYIGLEFGQIFRRFGSRVTVLERGSQIMSREDADVAAIAQKVLEREGVEIRCQARIRGVSAGPGAVQVELENGDSVTGSHLLVATGRRPNSDRLNLDAAGVAVDQKGYIVVDDKLQTTVPGIYALGDINGRGAFTHTSVNDGEILMHNLQGQDWKVSDRTPIYAMYIDPPLGRVGLSEKDALKSGRQMLVARMPMSHIARAREKGETDGVAKIIVDAQTDQLVGATVFGTGGDEVINMLAVVIHSQIPCHLYRRVVLAHPTVAELMPWVLDNLEPLRAETSPAPPA